MGLNSFVFSLSVLLDMNMKIGPGLESSPTIPQTRGLSSLAPGPQTRGPPQGPPTLPPQSAMQALPPRVPPSLPSLPSLPPLAPQLGPPFSLGPTDCNPPAPIMTAVPPPTQTALPPVHMQQSTASILQSPIQMPPKVSRLITFNQSLFLKLRLSLLTRLLNFSSSAEKKSEKESRHHDTYGK